MGDIFDLIYNKMVSLIPVKVSHLKHTRPSKKTTREQRKKNRQISKESRRKNR